MPASNVTVDVTYTINTHTLTINYVDGNNNILAAQYTDNVDYNDGYSVASPAVTGYTPDQATVSGTMPDNDVTVNVIYTLNSYAITATASPAAGGTVSGDGTYNYGDNCTLTATVNTGYTFDGWYENNIEVSTNASYSFTVTAARTLEARYTLNSYAIAATANPAVGGTVSGDGTYNHGATATLTATANTGYTFAGWYENNSEVSTNAAYSFTVTAARTLEARYTLNSYTIAVAANPAAGGTVTGDGIYNHGDNCTVTATASSECYHFLNWTVDGAVVSSSSIYSFTVEGDRDLVANFEEYLPSVSISALLDTTLCLGSSYTLDPQATGTGTLSYQWSNEATTASITVSPTETANYTVTVTSDVNGCRMTVVSNTAVVTVNDVPTLTDITAPAAVCAGSVLGLTEPEVGANGGSLTSQGWELSVDGESYAAFASGTPVSYGQDGHYLRYYAANACGTSNGNAVRITVNAAPEMSALAAPEAMCSGGELAMSSPSLELNGTTVLGQGWERSDDGQTWTVAVLPAVVRRGEDGLLLRYMVESSCGTTYSNTVQVTVNDVPGLTDITAPAAVCAGSALTLTAPGVDANGSAVVSQGWELSADGESYSAFTASTPGILLKATTPRAQVERMEPT